MALWHYLQVLPHSRQFPDPTGLLSSSMPSSVIKEAHAAIIGVRQEEATMATKTGPCLNLNNELKAKIGKHASENGDCADVRHSSKLLGKELNRNTVHSLRKVYLEKLSRKRKAGEDLMITSLPAKNCSRLLLL